MSKQVDERIVSMQFDNKHFEENVRTTMNSLDRLKEKLRFKDSSKGFNELNSAAKKTDLSPLAKSVETVQAKFSALDVIGVTALANITNTAVNAGKKILSALTIDPVTTGFKEYETQINAVQTILANTKSKGSTIDDVNAALEELNKYADQTIYNFTEMTRNIGTFTAAGVDLDTSTNAIKGIANLAAVSGSTSQQASTAMYQLSQALASGTVKLMDWNSVVNAGMGGQVFQDALKETARAHGVAIDSMITKEGSFRETLKDGWLTSEILTDTLQKFTLTTEGLTDAQIEANREMLRAKGYTEEQIDGIFELGNTATDAATKVKTFTQLWDVMKESAQSGWAMTWKLIIGDFEEAKALLTPLANFLTGAIQSFDDIRNTIIATAMGSPFAKFAEKIASIGAVTQSVSDKLKDYEAVVNRIINGEYGNGQSRWNKLAEEGYDWAHAQNLVNERLGDSTRHATEYTEAVGEVSKEVKELTDEELKNLGLTDDEIKMYRELEKQAKETGVSISELIENMSQMDGRTMMWEGLGNIGKSIATVFASIKNAWVDIFPPESLGLKLYNLISGFYDLSQKLIISDTSADRLKRTFKGLFAALDIVLTIVGGPIKLAFKAMSQFLGVANLDFLAITACLGDAMVGIRDFIDSVFDFTSVFKKMIPYLTAAADAVRGWVAAIRESGIAQDIIDGLANGIKAGISAICSIVAKLGTKMLEVIKDVLEIHSPSKKFFEIGQNIIDGLVNGVKAGLSKLATVFKGIGQKCIEFVKSIPYDKIISVAISAAIIYAGKKMYDLVSAFTAPLEGLGFMLESIGMMFRTSFEKQNARKWEAISKAILHFAIALAVLTASIVILSNIDVVSLTKAIVAVSTLGVVMVLLAKVLADFSETSTTIDKNGLRITGVKTALISMGIALLLMAKTVQILGELDPWSATQGFIGLGLMVVVISKVLDAFGKTVNGRQAANMAKFGGMMVLLSISLSMMARVVKMVAKLSVGTMAKGAAFITGFVFFIEAITNVVNITGSAERMKNFGKMVRNITVSILLMVGVCKVISLLSLAEVVNGAIFVTAFCGFLKLLVMSTTVASDTQLAKLSGLLWSVSFSLLLMVGLCKTIDLLTIGEMIKGAVFVSAFCGFLKLLIMSASIAPNTEIAKVSGLLLSVSLAIGILAGVCFLVGMLDGAALAKGLIVVTWLGLLLRSMIKATVGASDESFLGNLIVLAVAIGLIAAAVAALSFIEDTSDLLKATVALTAPMAAFALMLKAVSAMSADVNKALPTIIVMTTIIGALAYIIYKLSELDVYDSRDNGIAIAAMMASMGVALSLLGNTMKTAKWSDMFKAVTGLTLVIPAIAALAYILSKMGSSEYAFDNVKALVTLMTTMSLLLIPLSLIGNAFKLGDIMVGILSLSVMCGPLFAIAKILCMMGNLNNATTNAEALVKLMNTMTLLLIPLTILGAIMVISGGTAAIAVAGGVAALLVMCGPLFAIAKILCMMGNVDNATENTQSLITLMTTMTDLLFKLSVLAPLAILGIVGVSALTTAILAIGTLTVGIGALFDKFPKLEQFLDNGLPILEKLALGLGSMIGNFVGGMVSGTLSAISRLPEIGDALSEFILNATPFIAGSKLVDKSIVKAATNLAECVVILAAADFAQGLISFLSFGSSFADLGTELSLFMDNADGFIKGAKKVDGDLLTSVEKLVEIVKTLNSESFGSVIKNWVTDNASLRNFCTGLKELGIGINDFAKELKFDASFVKVIEGAAGAIQAIATIIPQINECSLIDSATFSAKLQMIKDAIRSFTTMSEMTPTGMKTTTAFTQDQLDTVLREAKAISEFGKAVKNIPEFTWGDVFSPSDIVNFVDSMNTMHTCLLDLTAQNEDGSNTFDQTKLDTLLREIQAISEFADVYKTIDVDEKFWESWFDANPLINLADGLNYMHGAFGKLKDAEGNATFTEEDLATIRNEAAAVTVIGEAVQVFRDDMTTWEKVLGSNTLSTFAVGLKQLNAAFMEIVSANADGLELNGDTMAMFESMGTVITSLGDATKHIGEESGLWEKIFGDTTLVNFGRGVKNLFQQIKSIVDGGYTISTDSIANLESEVTAIELLRDAVSGIGETDGDSIDSFGDGIESLAKHLRSYASKMNEVSADDIDSSRTKIEGIVELLKSMNDISTEEFVSFGESLVKFATDSVKGFTDVFNSASSKSEVEKSITSLVTAIPDTMTSESSKSSVESAANTLAQIIYDALKSETNYGYFVAAGGYVIDGFVSGMSSYDGLSRVTAAGTKIGDYAYKAAKKAIDAKSPSKKFAKLGLWSILGFGKGIKDNLKTVDESGRSMGTSVLTAFQDEMGIHSPSVVMDKQGRYIVQGIAKGISEETSAEKKAREKAQAIVEAFQKEFDKVDVESNIGQNEFELWKLTDGKNAREVDINRKEQEFLQKEAERHNKRVALAYGEWQETIKHGFKAGTKEEREAFNKYKEALINQAKTTAEIRSLKLQEWDNMASLAQQAIDTAESEYQTWLVTEGKYADKEKLYERLKNKLDYEELNLQDIENRMLWKLQYLKENGGTEQEIADAQEAYNTAVQNRVAKEDELKNLYYSKEYADKYEQFDKNEELRDRRARLWAAQNANASEEERLLNEAKIAEESFVDSAEEYFLLQQEYINILADYNNKKATKEQLEEVKARLDEAEIDTWEEANKKAQIQKDLMQNELDITKDKAELASEIAQHEYDVWEMTKGRKATDTEKDAKRLSMYAKQLESQKDIYEASLSAVRNARTKYGEDSQEYRDAYRAALNDELELVTLQDQIMDIKEDLEKRQKKQYNKQQLAMSEYKDYIKKYKQYYLEHGLTMEDLEADAKAAANYDPSKTVEAVVNKTSSALGDALDTSGAVSLGTTNNKC